MWQIDKFFYKGHYFIAFFSISLLLSVGYKYMLFYQGEHLKYTWIPDAIFFVAISLVLFYKRDYNLILITLALLLIKATSSLLIFHFYDDVSQYFKEVLKTVFSFSFVFFLYEYLKHLRKRDIIFIFNFFKFTLLLVCFAIIIGAIFSFSFSKTYINPRFGFSGLLYPSSFSSYFMITSTLILYFYNKNIKKISPVFIIITILSSLLIGTKAVYFFLMVFLLMLFITHKTYKNKIVMSAIALGSIFTAINYNVFKTFLINKFQMLYRLYLEENTLTFLLSFRNLSFQNAKVYISENWNIVNYLIGGINRKKTLVEMELIDIFLSLGVIGLIILVFFYYKILLKPIPFNNVNIVLFGTLFCVIILMGNSLKSITLSYILSFLYVIAIKNPLYLEKLNT